jgi:hypothetical protein
MGELKYIEAQTPARISNTTSNIMHNIPELYPSAGKEIRERILKSITDL